MRRGELFDRPLRRRPRNAGPCGMPETTRLALRAAAHMTRKSPMRQVFFFSVLEGKRQDHPCVARGSGTLPVLAFRGDNEPQVADGQMRGSCNLKTAGCHAEPGSG